MRTLIEMTGWWGASRSFYFSTLRSNMTSVSLKIRPAAPVARGKIIKIYSDFREIPARRSFPASHYRIPIPDSLNPSLVTLLMKYTYPSILISLTLLLLSTRISGALIVVSDLNAQGVFSAITLDGGDISSETSVSWDPIQGTVVDDANSGATNDSDQLQVFEISGLTIDDNGSGDDSLTFSVKIQTFGVTANTSTPSLTLGDPYALSLDNSDRTYWGTTGPLPGTSHNSGTGPIGPNEGIQFTFSGGSVTLGAGASTSYSLEFGGFSQLFYDRRQGTPGAVLDLDGVTTVIASPESDQQLDLADARIVALGSDSTGGTNFRLRDLDFSVSIVADSAVPEPASSPLLIGLLAFTGILGTRRRKEAKAIPSLTEF